MADYNAMVFESSGTLRKIQNTDSLLVGAGIKTSSGDLTLTPAGTNITVAGSKILGTTGSGNINLPNNGSARFQIQGSSVSANVTATNLGTLTAGGASNADALHTHAGLGASVRYCWLLSGAKITIANSTSEAIVGGGVYIASEHASTTVKLRIVGATTNSSYAIRCRLYDVTMDAYVSNLNTGVNYIDVTSQLGARIESLDILAGLTDGNLYQVRVTPLNPAAQGIFYSAVLVGA